MKTIPFAIEDLYCNILKQIKFIMHIHTVTTTKLYKQQTWVYFKTETYFLTHWVQVRQYDSYGPWLFSPFPQDNYM